MRRTALIAALLLFAPAAVAAQSLIWIGLGQNTDDATGVTTGENLNAGVALFRSSGGMALSGGLPLDPDRAPSWLTATGWLDRALFRPAWRLTGAGTGFVFSDPILGSNGGGSILSADVQRVFPVGHLDADVRVGGRHGYHSVGGESQSRALGRVGGGLEARTGRIDVRVDLDHFLAEEDGYTLPSVRVGVTARRFQAWAGAERWVDRELDDLGWEVGARVALNTRVAFTIRGGVQSQDILFWIPPRRTWAAGLQLRLGSNPFAAAASVPVLDRDGRSVTLSLSTGAVAGRPSVAGTFSGWQPVPMERTDGEWQVVLALEPGVHEYAFVDATGQWFVPEGTPGRRDDGFGGHVAVIIVQ